MANPFGLIDDLIEGGAKGARAVRNIISGLRKGGRAADEAADAVDAARAVSTSTDLVRAPSRALMRRPSTALVPSRSQAVVPYRQPGALVPTARPGALVPYGAADEIIDVGEAGARAIDEIAAAADEVAEGVAAAPGRFGRARGAFEEARAGRKSARAAKLGAKGVPTDPLERVARAFGARPIRSSLLTLLAGGVGAAGIGALRGPETADMSDEELLAVLATVGGGASPEQIVAQQRGAQEKRIRQLYGGLSPELQAELDQQQAAYQQALRDIGSNLATTIGGLYTGPISAAGAVEGAGAAGAEAARAAAAAPTGTDVSMVTPVAGGAAVAPASIAARGAEQAGLEGLLGTLSDQELARMVALGQLTGEQAAGDLARDYQAALLGTRIQDEREMRRALLDLEKLYAEPELMAAQARSIGLSALTPEALMDEARKAAIEWESMDDTTRAAYAQRGIMTAEDYIRARINQVAESTGLGEQ